MARGFATGLFHGALTGAVGLAALSLLLPAPRGANQDLVPDAAVIGTPSGSEFGRGDDAQPLLPAPLTRPTPAPLAGAASVETPADAPMMDGATLTAERPETRAEDPLAPPEFAPVTVDADIPSAPASDSRAAHVAPERVASPEPDAEPLPLADSGPIAAAMPAGQTPDVEVDDSAGVMPVPAMPHDIAELPIVRPGLPEPPAAESPADMSALTRGRPEDGLDPAGADKPVSTPDQPDAIEAAGDDSAGGEAVQPAPTAIADQDVARAVEPEVTEQPVAQAQGQTETALSGDVTERPDATDDGAAAQAPVTLAPEIPDANGRTADQQASDTSITSADAAPTMTADESLPRETRSFPAMNLSTPPDISGLLAGQ